MIKDEINKIINSIPKNLTEIEIAYYIYLELNKIFRFDTEWSFPISESNLFESFYENSTTLDSICSPDIMCKSFSSVYVKILKNLGIKAECFHYLNITHVDVILNIDNKRYYVNPVGDLYRIQTGMKAYNFAKNPKFIDFNLLKGLEQEFNPESKPDYHIFDFLSDEELRQMDEKFKHSFHGIYTNDTMRILEKEFADLSFSDDLYFSNDIKKLSKQNKNDALLKYKLEFLLNHLNILNEDAHRIGYVERVMYYARLGLHIFSEEESKKIRFYNCISENSRKNEDLISCIMLSLDSETFYYIYSKEENKYVQKNKEEFENLKNLSSGPPFINFDTYR